MSDMLSPIHTHNQFNLIEIYLVRQSNWSYGYPWANKQVYLKTKVEKSLFAKRECRILDLTNSSSQVFYNTWISTSQMWIWLRIFMSPSSSSFPLLPITWILPKPWHAIRFTQGQNCNSRTDFLDCFTTP